MGGEVSWLQDSTLILVRYFDRVTVEDVAEVTQRAADINESTERGAHMIVDVTSVTEFPTNILKLRGAIQRESTSRQGYVVLVVKQNALLKFIASTLIQMFSFKLRWSITETVEQALEIVNKQEVALQLAQPPNPSTHANP